MKEQTLDELISAYKDEEAIASVKRLAAEPATTGLVRFENLDFNSSQFGTQTIMCVGPTRTYKTIEECEGKHLYDLPSQRQYAVAYWRKEASHDGAYASNDADDGGNEGKALSTDASGSA